MTTPQPPSVPPWRVLRPVFSVLFVVLAGVGIVASANWLAETVGGAVGSFAEDDEASDVEPGIDVTIEVPTGASASAIGDILVEAGVVRSGAQFEAAARSSGLDQSLRAGSYDLVTGMTPDEVIEVMSRGPSVQVFDITVREGLRVVEMLDILSEGSGIPVAQFEAALVDGSVSTTVHDLPEEPTLTDWEGLLFPDTYRFSANATASDILNRMSSTMAQRMDSVDWSELEAAGFSRYEGIIMASLIEAEVRVAEERPLVAGVIRNRLRDGDLLEIDASVLYGLGTRDPAEFNNESDSPYNVYRFPGLPPTPIASPGLASLEAAAEPAETDFKFYVLAAEDGSHAFAVTFEEHLANVEASREAGILP